MQRKTAVRRRLWVPFALALWLASGATGCDGETKSIDCSTPDKCTGETPDPMGINARICAASLAEPACGAIYRQLLQCVYDRQPCPKDPEALPPAMVYCKELSDAHVDCRIKQSTQRDAG